MNTERLIPTSLSNPQITQIYTDGKPPGSNPCESVQSVVQKPDQPMSPVDAALIYATDFKFGTRVYNILLPLSAQEGTRFLTIEKIAVKLLAAEVRRLREQTRWRPIDTAPKDNTWVLVFDTVLGVTPAIFCTENNEWITMERNAPEPTHWMPLAAAPESGEKGGDL